jgi:hypothetical protein
MARNKIKKTVIGMVYIVLVDVLVRTTSGLSIGLDCSFFDRSFAVGT